MDSLKTGVELQGVQMSTDPLKTSLNSVIITHSPAQYCKTLKMISLPFFYYKDNYDLINNNNLINGFHPLKTLDQLFLISLILRCFFFKNVKAVRFLTRLAFHHPLPVWDLSSTNQSDKCARPKRISNTRQKPKSYFKIVVTCVV